MELKFLDKNETFEWNYWNEENNKNSKENVNYRMN